MTFPSVSPLSARSPDATDEKISLYLFCISPELPDIPASDPPPGSAAERITAYFTRSPSINVFVISHRPEPDRQTNDRMSTQTGYRSEKYRIPSGCGFYKLSNPANPSHLVTFTFRYIRLEWKENGDRKNKTIVN
ncbi:Hypothetical protein NTJ_03604 [Nesidiocoris tenuis]|uniref:Uncharacterized protein n=1 Tax=Nesidiocoris tenuis TaxID=355587 RepID=A0ABN7AIT6_9HEMI|nr:Hypothetical protein NTJ_03604 [Nesidiocoris tenuis]